YPLRRPHRQETVPRITPDIARAARDDSGRERSYTTPGRAVDSGATRGLSCNERHNIHDGGAEIGAKKIEGCGYRGKTERGCGYRGISKEGLWIPRQIKTGGCGYRGIDRDYENQTGSKRQVHWEAA